MKRKLLDQAVEAITNGGVIVMQSDTVIGLLCSARSPQAVARMYEIKKREGKPGTIIAASVQQLEGMGFDRKELRRAEAFWPDAVSVILSAPETLAYLHMGKQSLAVRIPKPEWLKKLLEETGPLATTSANLPGEPTVTTIQEANELFGSDVDAYIDIGQKPGATPSRIIRLLSDGSVERIR